MLSSLQTSWRTPRQDLHDDEVAQARHLLHHLDHRAHEEGGQRAGLLDQRLDDDAVDLGVELLAHAEEHVQGLHRALHEHDALAGRVHVVELRQQLRPC